MSYPVHPELSKAHQPHRKYLSVATAYAIRKLLRFNWDRLGFIVADGAGLKADPLSDLNSVLESLYLEDAEIAATVEELEHLNRVHQTLGAQSMQHHQQLRQTEHRIFWLLGFKLREVENRGRILLVDDNPHNLHLLSNTLTQHGYEVCSAISGALALHTVRNVQPDLILLDVRMAGIDGYEVCKRFKADPVTQDIPVIFISANNATADKVKAFDVGGMDYISKPFQVEEVLARVAHQLALRSLQKRLEEQNVRLQAEMQARQQLENRHGRFLEQSALKLLLRWMFQSPARSPAPALSSQFRERAIALLKTAR